MLSHADILGRFEALGDNCEFGLVQRAGGIEPLGLLRFAGFHIPVEYRLNRLIEALGRDFSGLGEPDTLHLTLEGRVGHEEYIVRESAYGLMYHTFKSDKDVDADTIRRQQSLHLRFLRRKLLEDLADASRVFVWKTNIDQSLEDTTRLSESLRRFGDNRLLWVIQGAEDYEPGTVEQLAPGLLRGHVDRFAPYDNAPDISFEAWARVCANALTLLEHGSMVPEGADTRGPQSCSTSTNLTIRRETIADVLSYGEEWPARTGIAQVQLIAPSGQYARRPPEKVYADRLLPSERIYHDYISTTIQDYPSIYCIEFASAIVTGQGAVISQDGRLLDDSCWEFFVHGHVPFGLRLDDNGILIQIASPTTYVHRPSLLVKRPWWRNFGHWMVDGAALLAMIPDLTLPSNYQVVVGTFEDPKMREVVYDMLKVLCPGVDVVEQPDDEMWLFSELYYMTPVHRPPLFKFPTSLHRLRSIFLPRAILELTTRRFFIQRGAEPRRPLENETEVLSICKFFNIQPVRPELLSIEQQISLFNSAEIIIGVKGAALANIIFCKATTKIIVLSPNDFADPFFWDIAGQLSLHYFEVFGPISTSVAGQAQNSFSIDTNDLTEVLLHATRDRKMTISGWQRSAR